MLFFFFFFFYICKFIILLVTLQEVRSQWEFASVCQFLNLFYNAVGLETFDTDVI